MGLSASNRVPFRGLEVLPTKATDTWAFGMTLYELLSRNMPYAHLRREAQVIPAIMQGELPHRPASFNEWPHSRKLLWDICQSCWHKDPKARPTMNDVVKQLESIITLQPMLDRQS
ncbi:uncharacterized protein FOMMEDRAFT_105270 [Fomitiporia mediterranea MF3/22]|uniref:uncharacterized protein n=1 Tax=Fomitiporia mediterranea (strain MF3/22) TaxID=694068 RepID=UPI00044081BD|nr:uncharacterized protein FOMMEDRAFT_105270 [Fomitiporia mediterranea MF3/22]EJD05032.1 hypothetical protein FOMMEDRAFT_105270 [Fomitiporia mediterranea MF3/22]